MSEWHLQQKIELSPGQHSCAGLKSVNEDAIGMRIPSGLLQTTKGIATVIADGVSAAEGGKEASEIAVHSFLADYFSTPDTWTVQQSAVRVLSALNRWLYGLGSAAVSQERGHLCTFSGVVIKSRTAHVFHVGDSRVYLWRKGKLEQLSRDHCRRIGENKSYLTRALGLDLKLDVDYHQLALEDGDSFFLSTDGLHEFVNDDEIAACLSAKEYPDAQCELLVQQALANGSDDNISCQWLVIDKLPVEDINETCARLSALPFPPELSPGMLIDGYRIKKQIHASSRSQLFVVIDEDTGERLCMKTPSVNFEDDPAYIERFSMESWIGKRVQSPHVVKVVEPDRPRSFLYYLTEYVDGVPLSTWIREQHKPAVEEAVYLLDQIGKGLRAFHRKQILHQDIKPDNIMIGPGGVVKIIDFGSCYSFGIAEIATPLKRDRVLGTADYSAPEHVLLKKVGPASDIFSLAVVAFEMLTGKLPFKGALAHCRNANAYTSTEYVAAYHENPLVPVWMDGAIRKSLRFLPERRFQEVDELIYDLQHPNPDYMQREHRPLAQRNPLRFWQASSGVLAVSVVVLLYLYFGAA
ncbi:MAG: protein kinase [Pseudomonadales bacterium]